LGLIDRYNSESQGKNKDLLVLDIGYSSQQNTISIDKPTDEQKVFELPMFSFSSIKTASANFSKANKLGEGGFGPVFKGSLLNGQSVAIKRLSKLSGQGLEELSNEATLIAKLQHRNLVRLLGCCTEKDEKILIYEYMPNKSLDFFLFDATKKELLDWNIRVRIIEGIAQGLLYLHEYSRLRIVHRDLKASNILLDGDMNPKISDFGVARIFAGNVLHATTHRIVGTYGYMSPEYAMDGRFSVKSDVFSFGVLLLELLSGRKNTGFHHPDFISLLGYAWMLWQNMREIEFIDPVLRIPNSSVMPRRYLGVGLLCVQESPDDRPNISDVLAMLCNEQTTLPSPGRPAFTAGKTLLFASSGKRRAEGTMNCLTISSVEAR
jgi:serine/threonine protein kinase